jgi:hypothetical protein
MSMIKKKMSIKKGGAVRDCVGGGGGGKSRGGHCEPRATNPIKSKLRVGKGGRERERRTTATTTTTAATANERTNGR